MEQKSRGLLHKIPISLVLFFAIGFLIGFIRNILNSVAMAMFLARFDAALINYVFILIGFSVMGMGLVIAKLEKKLDPFSLNMWFYGLFGVSLLSFWLATLFFPANEIYFAFLVCDLSIVAVLQSFLPILFNAIFTLQEAKHTFGYVIATTALGGISGGLALTVMGDKLPYQHYMLILAGLFVASVFLIFKLSLFYHQKNHQAPSHEDEAKTIISTQHKKHLWVCFLATFFYVIIDVFFELLLNSEIKNALVVEYKIGQFLGVLNALYDLFGLFIGLVVFNWSMLRLGVVKGILLFPVGVAALIGIAWLALTALPHYWIYFTLLSMTAIFENSLRAYFIGSAVLLLFQPLPVKEKLFGQTRNELFIGPFGIIVSGLFLLIGLQSRPIAVDTVGMWVMVLCLFMIAIMVFLVRKSYLSVLHEGLEKPLLNLPSFSFIEKNAQRLFLQKLQSPNLEEVIFALNTFERMDKRLFEKALAEPLQRSEPDLIAYALKKITDYHFVSLEEAVKKKTLTLDDPICQERALMALAALDFPYFKTLFQKLFHQSCTDHQVSAAWQALYIFGTADDKAQVVQQLDMLIGQADPHKRQIAALWVDQLPLANKADYIEQLLNDPDERVRQKIFTCAAAIEDERFYPQLIVAFGQEIYRPMLCQVFKHQALHLIHYLDRSRTLIPATLNRDLSQLACMGTQPSKAFLKACLHHPALPVVHSSLKALTTHFLKDMEEADHPVLDRLCQEQIQRLEKAIERLASPCLNSQDALYSFLVCEIQMGLQALFFQLALLKGHADWILVYEKIQQDDELLVSNVIEWIGQSLEPAISFQIIKIIEAFRAPPVSEKTVGLKEQELFFQSVIEDRQQFYIPSLLSAALQTLATYQLALAKRYLHSLQAPEDPYFERVKADILGLQDA